MPRAETRTSPDQSPDQTELSGDRSRPVDLRAPQVRILKCLAKTRNSLRAAQIAERADVQSSLVTGMLGCESPAARLHFEEFRNCRSLITWGYVRAESVVVDYELSDRAERLYSLTQEGRDALAELERVTEQTTTGQPTSRLAPSPRSPRRPDGEPLPPVGGSFSKEYRGVTYTVNVVPGGFRMLGVDHTSLTAVAKTIINMHGRKGAVNGWDFFGYTNPDAVRRSFSSVAEPS